MPSMWSKSSELHDQTSRETGGVVSLIRSHTSLVGEGHDPGVPRRMLVVADTARMRMRRLRHGFRGRLEPGWLLQRFELGFGDATQADDFRVDPRFAIDVGAAGDLEVQALRPVEVDRLGEPVIDRPEYLYAARAKPVTHREDLLERVDVERDVLHRAAADVTAGTVRVAHPELDVLAVLRHLHERDVAVRCELDEAVVRAFGAVHPVQRLQREAEDVAPELELPLHVGRGQREVVHTSRMEVAHLLLLS